MQHRTTLTDALDGGRADHTVTFSLDGVDYAVDLSAKHRKALHDSLAPYVAVSRRVRDGVVEPAHTRTATAVDSRAVREWARARRIALPPRGRIPQDVVDRFRAAGN